ncbi:hypothetical protein D3C81_1321520 [compost metagenome]
MFGGKVGGVAVRLAVDDEVHLALAVQHHVLGAVLCHQREAHLLEQRLEHVRGGRGEFHEFEAHQLHRVVKQVGHGFLTKGKLMIGSVRRRQSAVGQGGRASEIGIPVQRSAPSALAPGVPGREGRFVVMGAFRTGQSGNIIAVATLSGWGGAAASHCQPTLLWHWLYVAGLGCSVYSAQQNWISLATQGNPRL